MGLKGVEVSRRESSTRQLKKDTNRRFRKKREIQEKQAGKKDSEQNKANTERHRGHGTGSQRTTHTH